MHTSLCLYLSHTHAISRQKKYHNHGCRPEAATTNAAKTAVEEAAVAVVAALCAESMEKFGQTSVGHMQLHSHIGVLNLDPCPPALKTNVMDDGSINMKKGIRESEDK